MAAMQGLTSALFFLNKLQHLFLRYFPIQYSFLFRFSGTPAFKTEHISCRFLVRSSPTAYGLHGNVPRMHKHYQDFDVSQLVSSFPKEL